MTSLCDPSEPEAFRIVNGAGAGRVVLVCDHASNRVPRRLGTLGLTPSQLDDHIAWDPGAEQVAQGLAQQLDAPLILSSFSRLVIDCNRPLGHPNSIAMISDGVTIPGNVNLSSDERRVRATTLFQPYHDAIDGLLSQRSGHACCLLSIHSFTPILDGQVRPWPVGVSHWDDPISARLMCNALADRGVGPVGNNEPYPITETIDYTIPVHTRKHKIPALMIEIRNDGLCTPLASTVWANHIAAAYLSLEEWLLQDDIGHR
ncbi:N-formylglutamate amidohydrolase [Thiocapsa imhoffii]|uniref:N-formylglutamate amidohydrolase n=1 Tax=Thiocapsa imhoffii TaxID=382777 RepID=A0A9X1BB76_9GAMM|nr:N-formylglutamate amidohydrolase [Thiocapsa imhoffii]MBK1646431.1 N-formylglutamate amidohydrolase [Thiocapsa imhoffii]